MALSNIAPLGGIALTPALKSAIEIINKLDSQKFPRILTRVCTCIQDKPDNLKPFTDEEEEMLSATLSLGPADVKLMLDCSALILKQAAFHIVKPTMLRQQLSEHWNLTEEKADAFVSAWTTHAKTIVGALKRHSTHPNQVEGISWLMNVAVSSSDGGRLMEPRAVIELKVRPTDGERRDVTLDLDQSHVHELYETLETIQGRLDSLR